jgi:hypothetical protein
MSSDEETIAHDALQRRLTSRTPIEAYRMELQLGTGAVGTALVTEFVDGGTKIRVSSRVTRGGSFRSYLEQLWWIRTSPDSRPAA